MFSARFVSFVSIATLAFALPIRREVPQEHSHEPFLTSVRADLALDNPLNLGDPVVALLGNAAAAQGLGDLDDPDCLQQAIADQAFTNAAAAGDVQGQVDALIYRALERNSGAVGQTTAQCTSVEAVNPEIAAIQQHQDPAYDGAADVNTAIALELARQIASVGGDPQDALLSGTFEPGEIGDETTAGNTCNDETDLEGCIFTLKLLVPDASADEIDAAAAEVAAGGNAGVANNDVADAAADNADADAAADASAVDDAANTTASGAADNTADNTADDAADDAANETAGDNLQTFTGALGGEEAPAVTEGGRGFEVEGNADFLNLAAALGRSCDVQHNACANAANSGAADISVGDCDAQLTTCRAAIN